MRHVLILLSFVFLPAIALAEELEVPDPYPTIQSAIDAATDGDVVLIAPGIYEENIDFLGKAITVASKRGPETTIIRGVAADRSVVTFRSGEGNDSILQGLTIRKGQGTKIGAGVYGGGIVCGSGASPTIAYNVISANSTKAEPDDFLYRRGGGIALHENSSAIIVGNTIRENIVEGLIGGGSEPIRGGGGIYCGPGCTPRIEGNVIADNRISGAGEGGGIQCTGGAPIIENNEIRGNTHGGSAIWAGGGVALRVMTGGRVRWNLIVENVAAWGSGICVWGRAPEDQDLVISQNRIERNHMPDDYDQWRGGGGIFVRDSDVRILGNWILENESLDGGGIFVQNREYAAMPRIRKNRILRNAATVRGGGISLRAATAEIVNNVIAFNVSDGSGGGIHCLWRQDELPYVTNNTIVRNVAADVGGGVCCRESGGLQLTNSILWGNEAPSHVSIFADWGCEVEVSYCNVERGWPGEGNIVAIPRLVDPESDDFRLGTGSACVDSGSDSAPALPPKDMEGDDRPIDGDLDGVSAVDMGADECRPECAVLFGTVNAGNGPLGKVLFVNGEIGDNERIVTVGVDGPILFEMRLPPVPAPRECRYVVHADVGTPSTDTMTPLPAGLGWTAHPFLLPDGASPVAVFNCLGREDLAGASMYFDGVPIADPPSAPAAFLDLPAGDPPNLPPGTVMTLQGIIFDAGTAGSRMASVTNGIVLKVE